MTEKSKITEMRITSLDIMVKQINSGLAFKTHDNVIYVKTHREDRNSNPLCINMDSLMVVALHPDVNVTPINLKIRVEELPVFIKEEK